MPDNATIPSDDLLDDLIRAGNPSHIIKRVAKLMAEVDAINERRAKDAARKAAERAAEAARVAALSADIQGHVGHPRTSPSRAGARAEPETTNSSENTEREERKEERKIPPAAVRAQGKTLCPIDFKPSEAAIAKGLMLGLTLPAIHETAEAMREWSLGKGEKRLDWDLVLMGFMRRDAAKARASPQGSRAGNGSGFNGKPTLGDIRNAALAAIAARDANGRPNLELLAGPERRSGTGNGDNRPPDGIPRPADGPDGDRGDLLRGLLRVRAFPG